MCWIGVWKETDYPNKQIGTNQNYVGTPNCEKVRHDTNRNTGRYPDALNLKLKALYYLLSFLQLFISYGPHCGFL